MRALPGEMDVTLVSFYGEKSAEFSELIIYLQDTLALAFASAFRPYRVEQVHGTLIGLEGLRVENKIRNSESKLEVDPSALMSFLRRDDFPSIQVRVGGYRESGKYPFESRGQRPYIRSFSTRKFSDQEDIALAMGWPSDAGLIKSLDALRRTFESTLNIRHKYHDTPEALDNDFFFVLGRVDRQRIDQIRRQAITEQIRASLAGLEGVYAMISRQTFRIVAYLDPQLPIETSVSFRLDDEELTSDRLLSLYKLA